MTLYMPNKGSVTLRKQDTYSAKLEDIAVIGSKTTGRVMDAVGGCVSYCLYTLCPYHH